MKRILQALDNASAKPVEGVNDMKKFVQIINEGANPHKVSLPVQMAMQHYQQKDKDNKSSIIKEYFQKAEARLAEERAEEQEQKLQYIKQYSRSIANRVLRK
jgi:hypothetical protein